MKGMIKFMNVTKVSHYCGLFIVLFLLAVVLPTADAQDDYITDSYFPPKPENVVPDGWTSARTPEPAPSVWMPDADLRAAVEAELSAMDPPLTLTQNSLGTLLSIESDGVVNGRSISNLKGLEYATRLTWLYLRGNNISDISALSNLRNIESISLEENNVSDISALSNLTALTHLNISENSITDISALSDMTRLQILHLNRNTITDISALSDMTRLQKLNLNRNTITDISALSDMTRLRLLYLQWNNISDISALSDLTELIILTLGNNNTTDDVISDISHLSGLVKLEELYISSNNISNITHLSGLTKLRILNLTANSIESITTLSSLTELEHLYLWGNSITDISPIEDLTNLQNLDLRQNNISNISYLSDLDNVEILALGSNNISVIPDLLPMDGLVQVDLTRNPIWDINMNTYTLMKLREREVEVNIDDLVPFDPILGSGIDTVDPDVSIIVPPGPQSEPFEVRVEFTERVSDFEQADLVLDPTTRASTSPFTTTDDITYRTTVTPTSNGDVTFSIAANVARDAAYNRNTAATSDPVTIDIVDPDVSITVPEGTQSEPFDVTVVFTEPVTGFDDADLVLAPQNLATVAFSPRTGESATTYTATITPVIDGDITFSVDAGVATDTAGNENTATTRTWTVPVDVPEPEVSITVPSGIQNEPFNVTVVFTQIVSDFDQDDVDLGGTPATITEWTPDPTNAMRYDAIVTPTNTTPGEVTIDVSAGVVTNAIGTPNDAAPSQTVSVDLPPNVSITVLPDVQNAAFEATVVFTDAVSGFDEPELVLGGDAIASITSFTTTDNTTYRAEITPTSSGEVTFDIAAGVATDNTANLENTAASQLAVTIDLFVEIPDRNLLRALRNTLDLDANASVTESQMASLTTLRYVGTNRRWSYRIQDLSGLEYATNLESLTLQGNRISDPTPIANLTNLTTLSISKNYIKSISFLTNLTNLEDLFLWSNKLEHISGGVFENLTALRILSLRKNPIINLAANRETRDTLQQRPDLDLRIDRFVDDETAPNVEISTPSGTQNAAFEVTFTFTEPVFGFEAADVALDGVAAEITDPQPDSTDEKIYTVTITPTDTLSGNITIDIPEDAVTDESDNGNAAATTQTVAVDLPPQVSFNIPSKPQYGAFKVKIIFSEPVTGFVKEDIVLGGTATAEITSFTSTDQKKFDVSINTISKGDLTISVPAGVATDGTNGNIAATSDPVDVDLNFVIEFTDANLAREIRHTLDLDADEDITKIQMLRLIRYDSRSPNHEKISDLSGLEHATNVTRLNFSGNSITDFTALEALPKLTRLTLSSNGITDITELVNLTNLTYVNLRFNQITDVSPLETMTGLEGISISGNPFLDTSPLYRLLYNPQSSLNYVDISISQYPPWDVNEDGSVDDTDSGLVTAAIGQTGADIVNPRTDVDGDDDVDADDLLLVTENIDETTPAPLGTGNIVNLLDPEALETLDRDVIKIQLQILHANSDGSAKYLRAIALLESILGASRPKETTLLANYPNPFNPETWIPYHLANASKVHITIYDVGGTVIRQLDLGHQSEGYYINQSRAAYWDGRNNAGERVASGIYFYQFEADNVSLLRKMIILK